MMPKGSQCEAVGSCIRGTALKTDAENDLGFPCSSKKLLGGGHRVDL